jgi:hypothetical protein
MSAPVAVGLRTPVGISAWTPGPVPARPPVRLSASIRSVRVRSQLAARHARPRRPAGPEPQGLPAVLVVGLLVLMAATLVPERPQDQAAICQRHNGPVACRVW